MLDAVCALARQQGSSLGAVINGLVRESLRSTHVVKTVQTQRSGLPLLSMWLLGGVVDSRVRIRFRMLRRIVRLTGFIMEMELRRDQRWLL